MIITVEELRQHVDTAVEDQALEAMLQALGLSIHGYTNNNFKRVLEENNGEYPMDVKMGCVDIIRWQLKNEAANGGDTSQKDVQSETISRYSVTYATDASETDLDEKLGVPKKHTAFLKPYMKARFGRGIGV